MKKFKAKDHVDWAKMMVSGFKVSGAEWHTEYGMRAKFDHDKKQLTILRKGLMPPGEIEQHKKVFALVGYKVVVDKDADKKANVAIINAMTGEIITLG